MSQLLIDRNIVTWRELTQAESLIIRLYPLLVTAAKNTNHETHTVGLRVQVFDELRFSIVVQKKDDCTQETIATLFWWAVADNPELCLDSETIKWIPVYIASRLCSLSFGGANPLEQLGCNSSGSESFYSFIPMR